MPDIDNDGFIRLLPRIGETRREQAARLGIALRTLFAYLEGTRKIPLPTRRLAQRLAEEREAVNA